MGRENHHAMRAILVNPVAQTDHDSFFSGNIERRSRLVKQQDRRVAQNRASEAEPLRLPERQLRALLAEHRFEPGRQRTNEVTEARPMERRGNVCRRCVRSAVRDVVTKGCGEERILLQRDRQHPAPRRQFEAVDRFTIEQDASRRRLEESHDQRDDGALAGAAGAGDRGDFADARLEAHAGQHRRSRVVAKGHVVEAETGSEFRRDRMAAADALLGRLADHFEHPRDCDDHVLHAAPEVGEVARALADPGNQRERTLKQSQRHCDVREAGGSTRHHFGRADVQRRNISEAAQCVGEGAVAREHQACAAASQECVPVLARVVFRFARFGAERLDGFNRRQRFLDARGGARRGLAFADEGSAQRSGVDPRQDEVRRQQQRRDQRQPGVIPDQIEQRSDGGGNENERLNDQPVDDTRNRGGVLEHPEDRVADFLLRMKADAQLLHPRVEVDAEEVADAL